MPTDRKATVVAIAGPKGGIGKTTLTSCLAASLTRKFAKRVLVLDLDPQGDLSLMLNHTRDGLPLPRTAGEEMPEGSPKTGIGRIMLAHLRERSSLLRSSIVSIPGWTDFVAPGSDLKNKVKELATTVGPEVRLRQALSGISSDYDYVLIDCPLGQGLLVTNALAAADRVVVPMEMRMLSFHNLTSLLDEVVEVRDNLDNTQLEVSVIVPTMLTHDSHSRSALQALLEFDATPFLEPQQTKVYIAPPIPDLVLYANLSRDRLNLYEHKETKPRHIQPFEELAAYLVGAPITAPVEVTR